MVSHLFFYQLVLVALVWLCLMLHGAWPSDPAAVCPTAPEPTPPVPKRHRELTPFAVRVHRGGSWRGLASPPYSFEEFVPRRLTEETPHRREPG